MNNSLKPILGLGIIKPKSGLLNVFHFQKNKMEKISETLQRLNLTSKETATVFSTKTRDNNNLNVIKDKSSGVIYIDDFYVGDEEYIDGEYRQEKLDFHQSPDFERVIDTERRLLKYKRYYAGLDICDVGCGAGDFLKGASIMSKSVSGVELQENYLNFLNNNDIPSLSSIKEHDKKFDTIFSFHALEHFNNPIDMLNSMKDSLLGDGKIIIEVPHANDFLISTLKNQAFIDFTLWSQHLILHTRDSLKRFLLDAGFSNIIIEGVQRYPLSNHLTWLSDSKPGGHKSNLALFDKKKLHNEYESALNSIDATDTLVAIASV